MSQVQVGHLLAEAEKVVARVRYCWLLTAAETGGANARPMGRLLPGPNEDDWIIRFITGGLSRKVFDIRRASKVGLIFQDADDAFVVLIGRAKLLEGASSMRQLWKDDYDVYFPGEEDRANATFVEVNVERMELWIRGVTPEPFGLHTTILERDATAAWRLNLGKTVSRAR